MTKWLNEQQQRHWRAWLTASTLLEDQFNRELQESQGLTMADYEILVRLSDTPERRIRMSELAAITLSSRSRLTHQINRMELAGFVTREACEGDRRGQLCVMTNAGWKALVAAAPSHVESVRKHFVDVLSNEEFAALGRAAEKVAAHLDDVIDRS